jgi:hypothetical protein
VSEPLTTWLPNLVGGVSIWKLARDLNAPHLFDGRLLVPDTEGPDSLPSKVTWSLSGLVPLAEARASAPADVAQAITDFLARLEKVGLELKDSASGFHRFKEAFTVPGLDADGGAHYYFDAQTKKLCVINWGASPRAIAGAQSLVFGWQSFDKVAGAAAVAAGAVAVAGASAAGAPASPTTAAAEAAPADEKPKDEKKDEEKKREEKEDAEPALLWGRPWWQWLLVLLAAAGIVALVLFLLRECNELSGSTTTDAASADSEAGAALEAGASSDGATDATLDGEAGADASPDATTGGAPEGSADAASDGPTDAKTDGASDAKSDARTDGGAAGAGLGNGGPGVGVGVGPGNGVVVPGHDPGGLPHRFHFEPDAIRWRISAGQSMLDSSSPVEGVGQNFEVILKPGGSFDGVKVQWQDASGHWHQ